jgi:sugar/nucleoside kinase (ribokinase family)
VADTVGAGDAFAGGVLAALLHGATPETALHAGTAAGVAAVAAAGADPGAAGWARAADAVSALVRAPALAPAHGAAVWHCNHHP